MARTADFSSESGLRRYLDAIKHLPMLTQGQEQTLAKRWRENNDPEAAHQLVVSHLRLVAKVAMRYRGYGLPMSEVISEGSIGLIKAVNRFEPERGFRLATYAIWWIKASIREYVLRSWSLVKIGTTPNQRKLFFNLRRLKARLSALDDGDLHPDQVELIASDLGVTEKEVVYMNSRLGGDTSLNAPLRGLPESEWQDLLVESEDNQEYRLVQFEEASNRRRALIDSLGVLNARERCILEARRLADDPRSLADLSNEFGVSRERVRQIEMRAFEKLQNAVKVVYAKRDEIQTVVSVE
ncbi:RNA polymerase sigma factor RpoH [Mesorhizobium sp. YC-39]|uniref:RNA polymerase sigma factor RpoH n=1 Tax=unclassified Mesorhizobium TaxID=325217 RepID=UPI0021E97542|nr:MULTISPECIES: RNA polymerase sigma factor RpoH [unclassified Mesorhizobium]MCV3206489.1 RNA polymerase sigma factor RpoH [Mesorhizobium sp. YC-2]MCV3227111.1 RNA polymerase sigma factor RpoH [Mesorhizobium sp. YC-39]